MSPESRDRDAGQRAIEAIRRDPHDDEAWARFYDYFYMQVAAALFMSGCARDDVPDVSQEVFRRFLEHSPWRTDWSTLPDRPHLTNFLRKTARWLALDRHRALGRRPRTDDAIELDQIPAESIVDLSIPLDRVVAALNDEERRLLGMVIDGVPLASIAFELGISYQAAGVRVHRLRRRIQEIQATQPLR
jgi:DNA-directed RNA polymerase specialized sigma24 family protein